MKNTVRVKYPFTIRAFYLFIYNTKSFIYFNHHRVNLKYTRATLLSDSSLHLKPVLRRAEWNHLIRIWEITKTASANTEIKRAFYFVYHFVDNAEPIRTAPGAPICMHYPAPISFLFQFTSNIKLKTIRTAVSPSPPSNGLTECVCLHGFLSVSQIESLLLQGFPGAPPGENFMTKTSSP